jgi:hypothetical protein
MLLLEPFPAPARRRALCSYVQDKNIGTHLLAREPNSQYCGGRRQTRRAVQTESRSDGRGLTFAVEDISRPDVVAGARFGVGHDAKVRGCGRCKGGVRREPIGRRPAEASVHAIVQIPTS